MQKERPTPYCPIHHFLLLNHHVMHNDEAQELLADLRRLSEESPSLATTYTIGNSVLGQTLQVVLEMSGPIVNRDQSEGVNIRS